MKAISPLMLCLFLLACSSSSPTSAPAVNAGPTPCPIPAALEERIRAAFAPGGLEPGSVLVGGEKPTGTLTFTVPAVSGGVRFEDVALEPCAVAPVSELMRSLKR